MQRVWGGDTFVTARSVDTLVKRLRQKIEDEPAEPALDPDRVGRRLQGRRCLSRRWPRRRRRSADRGGRVVWYRSLYWRIALGFVATVALVLVLQAALFLWLASTNDTIAMRPARVATRRRRRARAPRSRPMPASTSTRWLAREFGRGPHGVFVVRGDRLHRSGPFDVPPFLVADGAVPAAAPGDGPPAGWPARHPTAVRRPTGARRGRGARRSSRSWSAARRSAVVGVLPAPAGRDPVLAEFGPTLIAAALALLVAGTAVMAILVFRPVHRRLRGLEQAAAAVGAGETAVRAPESGGDEVASLAPALQPHGRRPATRACRRCAIRSRAAPAARRRLARADDAAHRDARLSRDAGDAGG